MPSEEEIIQINELTSQFEGLFPLERDYGTKSSLWYQGLKNGIATEDIYYKAARYYAEQWNQAHF